MSVASAVDRWLLRHVGYTYLRATRDDAIFDRIAYFVEIVRAKGQRVSVLDVGCGGGVTLEVIAREISDLVSRYVGLDWNASRLSGRYAHLSTPHEFFDVDLNDDWNFGQFDVAWCSECLEHITDDAGVFRKIYRSVRPGGSIVVTMPSEACRYAFGGRFPGLLQTSATEDGGHVRVGYTPDGLRGLASGTGASLVRVDAVTKFDDTYIRRRYDWPDVLQPLRSTFYSLTRSDADRYRLSASPTDFAQYHSIAAVYTVA